VNPHDPDLGLRARDNNAFDRSAITLAASGTAMKLVGTQNAARRTRGQEPFGKQLAYQHVGEG
jgi:hypothetical protein